MDPVVARLHPQPDESICQQDWSHTWQSSTEAAPFKQELVITSFSFCRFFCLFVKSEAFNIGEKKNSLVTFSYDMYIGQFSYSQPNWFPCLLQRRILHCLISQLSEDQPHHLSQLMSRDLSVILSFPVQSTSETDSWCSCANQNSATHAHFLPIGRGLSPITRWKIPGSITKTVMDVGNARTDALGTPCSV